MRVPNKPSIIRAHCIHFSTYTPFLLTFLILIQAAQQLTVLCLKNISMVSSLHCSGKNSVDSFSGPNSCIYQTGVNHPLLYAVCVLEDHTSSRCSFQKQCHCGQKIYFSWSLQWEVFCLTTCVELSLVSQPQVKRYPYHVSLLAWQRIQVHVVARTNTTSKRVPWRPPSLWKYRHHLKRFQSRLRILSNKVEWGDKKPKQQEAIFPTGVSQFSLHKMLWGGEPKVEFVLILW